MISAFRNIFKVKDLRKKILYTLFIIALIRILQNVPVPGVNVEALKDAIDNVKSKGADGAGGILNLLNIFTGGALQQCAIGFLGIMP